jgi:hypothetical protein
MPTHNGPTHNGYGPEGHGNEEVDTSLGYESSDVKVTGILWFLFVMGIFVAVTAITCYGIGKVLNAHLNREDGPNSKWTQTVDIRQLGNLPSNPEMQNRIAQLTQTFPTPRVQVDDGNQDVADLHAREDILLDNYTWIDQGKGTVRIPIERAMELIAQKGLPVAPAAQAPTLMTGDTKPVVTMPLTDGFARTGYELEKQAEADALKRQEAEAK